LFFTFAFPILFMLIFGLVFSGGEDVNFKLGLVYDGDGGAGGMVVRSFEQIPIFDVSEGVLDDKLQELRDGDIRAVVVVPDDIEVNLEGADPADITVYYDPAHTSSAQVLLPVLRQVISEIDRQMTQRSVLFLGLFGGLPLVEWREKKILKRLGAAPLNRATVVGSQVTYRLMLSVVQAIIIIVIARFAFNVQMVGNWFFLLGVLLLGTVTFISIGYFAVSRARTVEGAMPIVQVVQFPMMFLSGIFFPVDMMPDFMRPIMDAIPLSYLGDAFRQIMVDATPIHSLPVNIIVLAAWLVVSMVLAIRLFSWE
jgi:ABC-2 type transport system permease protein